MDLHHLPVVLKLLAPDMGQGRGVHASLGRLVGDVERVAEGQNSCILELGDNSLVGRFDLGIGKINRKKYLAMSSY